MPNKLMIRVSEPYLKASSLKEVLPDLVSKTLALLDAGPPPALAWDACRCAWHGEGLHSQVGGRTLRLSMAQEALQDVLFALTCSGVVAELRSLGAQLQAGWVLQLAWRHLGRAEALLELLEQQQRKGRRAGMSKPNSRASKIREAARRNPSLTAKQAADEFLIDQSLAARIINGAR